MKKLLRFTLISCLALPVLTVTKAWANNDHGNDHGNRTDHGFWDMHRSGRRDFDHHWEDRFRSATPAQPIMASPDPIGPSSGGGESAPIDGGLSLLLAAGIGLGMKKAHDRNKALKQQATDIAG